jgi:integrase
VPIGADLVAALRRHRLATARVGDAFVFTTRHGEPYAHTGRPRSSWTRSVEAAKIPDPQPTIHHARHAYASLQLLGGSSMHEVAQLLGHADSSLVARLYGHAMLDRIAKAGDRLGAVMRGDGG